MSRYCVERLSYHLLNRYGQQVECDRFLVGSAGGYFLKLGRHRARTKRSHRNIQRLQLRSERFTKARYISFGRCIDRAIRNGEKAGDRANVEYCAAAALSHGG